MSIVMIIFLSVLTMIIILGSIAIGLDSDYKAIPIIVAIVICLALWGVAIWYYQNTESGKRALKTQKSNLGGGITREVKVYDVEGDLIAQYKGKFDIEYDDDRILFDDENGNRHVIYYPTGNVIVDEVE